VVGGRAEGSLCLLAVDEGEAVGVALVAGGVKLLELPLVIFFTTPIGD
jgi:hypothetical protein